MPTAEMRGRAESQTWCARFRANKESSDGIPWDDPYRLSDEERAAIEGSVQQFQLGEGSQGRRLLQRGAAYARSAGDTDFIAALALFVEEE